MRKFMKETRNLCSVVKLSPKLQPKSLIACCQEMSIFNWGDVVTNHFRMWLQIVSRCFDKKKNNRPSNVQWNCSSVYQDEWARVFRNWQKKTLHLSFMICNRFGMRSERFQCSNGSERIAFEESLLRRHLVMRFTMNEKCFWAWVNFSFQSFHSFFLWDNIKVSPIQNQTITDEAKYTWSSNDKTIN